MLELVTSDHNPISSNSDTTNTQTFSEQCVISPGMTTYLTLENSYKQTTKTSRAELLSNGHKTAAMDDY
jgi:hypothetical protein